MIEKVPGMDKLTTVEPFLESSVSTSEILPPSITKSSCGHSSSNSCKIKQRIHHPLLAHLDRTHLNGECTFRVADIGAGERKRLTEGTDKAPQQRVIGHSDSNQAYARV